MTDTSGISYVVNHELDHYQFSLSVARLKDMNRRSKKLGRTRQLKEASMQTKLRIIGGKYGGRQIQYSGEQRTRPMKNRVREAMFNLVGPWVKGTYTIDLFAGTGAVGLESVSRGSVGATLIEPSNGDRAELCVGDVLQLVYNTTHVPHCHATMRYTRV